MDSIKFYSSGTEMAKIRRQAAKYNMAEIDPTTNNYNSLTKT